LGTSGKVLRRIRSVWSDEPTSFTWVKDGKLAASGYPSSRAQILWLKGQGIASILTLTEEPLPPEWLEGTGIRSRHIAMVDHEPPSITGLGEAVSVVEEEVLGGRPILVHCLAGKGRTMCVVGAYLMKTENVSADGALEIVRSIRPGAVEKGQDQSLRLFASKLGAG